MKHGGIVPPTFQWPDGRAQGSSGSIAHPSHALQQLLWKKERQDLVDTAIASSLPCSTHREFFSFLSRREIRIHSPKQEDPARLPKRFSSEPSLSGCSSYPYKGAICFCLIVLSVIPCSSECHREAISWESDCPTVCSPNSASQSGCLCTGMSSGAQARCYAGTDCQDAEHLGQILASPQVCWT